MQRRREGFNAEARRCGDAEKVLTQRRGDAERFLSQRCGDAEMFLAQRQFLTVDVFSIMDKLVTYRSD